MLKKYKGAREPPLDSSKNLESSRNGSKLTRMKKKYW